MMEPPLKEERNDTDDTRPTTRDGARVRGHGPTSTSTKMEGDGHNNGSSMTSTKGATSGVPTTPPTSARNENPSNLNISFSHIQLYVDNVESLGTYKSLERKLNKLSSSLSSPSLRMMMTTTASSSSSSTTDLEQRRMIWKNIVEADDGDEDSDSDLMTHHQPFVAQKRDIIKQLMVGFGLRVTGYNHHHYPPLPRSLSGLITEAAAAAAATSSYLVTTKDPNGIQIVVTAPVPTEAAAGGSSSSRDDETTDAVYHHFDKENLLRFFQCHHGRQGVAVLAFQVDDVDEVQRKYKLLHPNLIHSYHVYHNDGNDGEMTPLNSTKILDVYAYYERPSSWSVEEEEEAAAVIEERFSRNQQPDMGTVIRFVESSTMGSTQLNCLLPGITRVDAEFDLSSSPCYFDHWVSNVYSRKEFLKTLHETLGFDTKVDFNAGIVAAGEAQIESTVTGNESTLQTSDKSVALKDQTQVFLPINNALSPVGHVHGFLQEIGQGIQHIANRVENLVEFISRCNLYREITGEGLTTLDIPRSYYGVLTQKDLVESAGISWDLSRFVMDACMSKNIVSSDGAIDLDVSSEKLERHLDAAILCSDWDGEYVQKKVDIIEAILTSRYVNIQKLLRNHITEESYLGIVRNQILCDVQGDDVLFQIFTCNILQNNPGDEAPFLEFIQRVCSECEQSRDGECLKPIKPGCGGFGIRNFLTLFLSIEVSKAMMDVSDAKTKGDNRREEYAQKRVDAFTEQLNESNPILTRISNAMTEEGQAMMKIKQSENDDDVKYWTERLEKAREDKVLGNDSLKACSERYQHYMQELRKQMEQSSNTRVDNGNS